jgi:hypothetical protein
MLTRSLIATAAAAVVVLPAVGSAARVGPSTRGGSAHRSAAGQSSAGVGGAKGASPGASAAAATARVRTSSPDVVYRAPWPTTPIVTPSYIYQPSSAVSLGTVSQADTCADFGTGCTDEQLCATWAINCAESAVSPDPLSQANECADFATGCTPAQVCAIWALDCPADPQPQDATADVPSATGA